MTVCSVCAYECINSLNLMEWKFDQGRVLRSYLGDKNVTVCSVCAYECINSLNLMEWRLKHFEDLQSNLILKRPLTFLRKANDGEQLYSSCTQVIQIGIQKGRENLLRA